MRLEGPVRLFAVATPGLEGVVAGEAARLPGASDALAVPGGVELMGDARVLYAANLRLRVASRVLVRLGEVRATDFARLRKRAAALSWDAFAAGPVRVTVAATAHRCRLYHTGAVAERVRGAIADRLGPGAVADADAIDADELHVVVRGEDDLFTVSIDSSGQLLHRRGWRIDDAGAPLRETLAGGLLALAGWRDEEALVDPTCGAGTIAIEAALAALGRAPGARRDFAFQRWPGYRDDVWRALVAEATAAARPTPPRPIAGADVDPEALAAARRNAARAEIEPHVAWEEQDVTRAPPLPRGPGLLLCNPPYGKRLRGPDLGDVYRALGRLARSAPGWRLALLTSEPRLARLAGRPAQIHRLVSGGLPVALYVYGRG